MEDLSDDSSIDTQESTYLSFIESLNEDELIELTTTCYEIIDDYVEQNILHICEPNYYDIINNEIMCYFVEFWEDANIFHDENDDDISEFINKTDVNLIEWSEKAMDALPTPDLIIFFTYTDQDGSDGRNVRFKSLTSRGEQCIDLLV